MDWVGFRAWPECGRQPVLIAAELGVGSFHLSGGLPCIIRHRTRGKVEQSSALWKILASRSAASKLALKKV